MVLPLSTRCIIIKTKQRKQNNKKTKRDSYRIIVLSRNGNVIEAAYFDFVGIWLKEARKGS